MCVILTWKYSQVDMEKHNMTHVQHGCCSLGCSRGQLDFLIRGCLRESTYEMDF